MFAFGNTSNVYAIGTFSKDDWPFGISNDDWASEYWNKWIGKNADEATPQAGGCLLVNGDNKIRTNGYVNGDCSELSPNSEL